MRAGPVARLAVCISLCLAPLRAQSPELFFDSVDVNVINLEVMVTDREGRAVTGLGPEDFTILEDGREVELTNFFVVEGGQTLGAGARAEESVPEAPVSTLVGPETERLQLVIFVDNLGIRPENRNPIFDRLRRFIRERLDPRDRVMIAVADDEVEQAQTFTSDPIQLLATIDRLESETGRQVEFEAEYRTLMRAIQSASLAVPGQVSGPAPENPWVFESAIQEAKGLAQQIGWLAERRYRVVLAAVDALERFIDTLAGMRGRKGVLYVSDGLPVRTADALVEAWMGKYSDWLTQTDQDDLRQQLVALNSLEFDASRELRGLVEQATVNQVAFYPISSYGRGGTSMVSAEYRGSGTTGGGGPFSRDVSNLETFNREASLLQLADGTGGIAYTRSSDIGGLLDRIRQDFSTFYSLGFQRPPESGELEEERVHELEVRVRGEELKVRHRRSYAVQPPLERLESLTLAALHHGLEKNAHQARLEAGHAVRLAKNRYRVPVMVAIPFQGLLLLPQDDAHVARVTLMVAARDERGNVSPVQQIELPVSVPNDQIADALNGAAGYPMQLDMKAGRQRISVGIWDHLARVESTVSLELDVGAEDPAASTGADR